MVDNTVLAVGVVVVVRLLTINLFLRPNLISSYWGGEHKEERMRDFVDLYADRYDVIALQETFGSWGYRRERLIEAMREKGFTGYVHSNDTHPEMYFCGKLGCFRTSAPYISGDAGLLIFSRYDIVGTEELVFSASAGADSLVRKGVLHARLDVGGGRRLSVFTTHLQAGPARAVRRTQIDEMAAFIGERSDNEDEATVVCGDFNIDSISEAEEYEYLMTALDGARPTASFRDTMRGSPPTTYGHANIFNEGRGPSPRRIDYVFSMTVDASSWEVCADASRIEALDAPGGRPYKRLSDHDGVSARLEIKNAP